MTKSLNKKLNRRLDCRLNHPVTLGQRRKTDSLMSICRLLEQCLRFTRRMVRSDPHLFSPGANGYFLETLQLEREQMEIDVAIRKVYGPRDPECPVHDGPWKERYVTWPAHKNSFRRWFAENYSRPVHDKNNRSDRF